MHTYVAVVAKEGERLPPGVLQRLQAEQPDLHFDATCDRVWSDPTGSVLVRGWERPNPAFGIESHWSQIDGGITAFVGHLWPRPHGWSAGCSWAEQLARRCRTGGVDRHIEDLAGVYSAVTLDHDGRGWVFSDPLGIRMIYTGETPEYAVYSSRASVVAWVLGSAGSSPGRDPHGVAWLPYAAHLVGDRTGFSGVRTLPQGSYVDVDPRRGARVRIWSPAPWAFGPELESAEQLIEGVRQDIADHLRVVIGLPASEKVAALTGGRDSRLILAVLLSEGLEDAVTFQTRGSASLPDVAVARDIAAHHRLDHTWGVVGPATSLPYGDRVAALVHDSCGMLNIWDSPSRVAAGDAVNISGLCGEIMGTHFPQTSKVTTWEELAAYFSRGWRFGTVGLLRAEVHATLEREARASLFDDPGGASGPLDLIDAFFLRHRLRRWTGTEDEIDLSNRVFPLYSLRGLRAAFAVGAAKRRAEFIHYHVMRISCPSLVSRGFAAEGWPEAILVDGGLALADPPAVPVPRAVLEGSGARRRVALRRKARRRPPQDPMTANQLHHQRTLVEQRPVLEERLVGDPANPVFDIIDRKRALDAMSRIHELDLQDRIRLFGAVTAAIWLGAEDARRTTSAGTPSP